MDAAGLPWGPTAPSTARHLAAELLGSHAVPAAKCREALLVISELVTNAVQHGQPPLSLRVVMMTDEMRIEVADGGPAAPRPRTPPVEQAGGRGLDIVSQLSSEWGWRRSASGKTVWCCMPLGPSGDRR